jgi:isoleucyl-tRNA synthetase
VQLLTHGLHHPILVHTAEEVWTHTPHVKEESVHLADMPKVVEVDQACCKNSAALKLSLLPITTFASRDLPITLLLRATSNARFTAEEVWTHTPHVKEESVHLADMPKVVEVDQALLDKWNQFMANEHFLLLHAVCVSKLLQLCELK